MKIFYKPNLLYLFSDLSILVLWIYIILEWFPLTSSAPFEKYLFPAVVYILTWGIWSYLLGRYKPLKEQHYYKSTHKLFYSSIFVLILFHLVIFFYFMNILSHNVLYTVVIGELSLSYILLTIYFSYRYAIEYKEIANINANTESNFLNNSGVELNDNTLSHLLKHIKDNTISSGLNFVKKNVNMYNGNVYVYKSKNINNKLNQYFTVIQLEKLNNVLNINKMLTALNKSVQNNGTIVCCYETKSTYKKAKLKKHKGIWSYILYTIDFIIKRVLPKLFVTRWFYYLVLNRKYQVLSKAEVLGRMYYCGFKIEQEKKVGQLNYVLARKIAEPDTLESKTYGPLIKLRRFGKNAKVFNVYKLRTMHPYSEFLQAYIYEKNSLQEGGKFNKDIRVTTLGRIMRKFWIDELPMLINVLKGDMKLVGVRPLSSHYFSLYSQELQEKRTKFKPGLLPPFYADMPKTMEEIQLSELKYLQKCEENDVISTDIQYLYLILKNIFINKARSA